MKQIKLRSKIIE
jgi:hypothetical protein